MQFSNNGSYFMLTGIRAFRHFTAITTVCLLLSASAHAMTNQDVIKLLKSDIAEDTVIVAIRNDSQPEYDTSVDSLISLKSAGVSDEVIQAMIKKSGDPAAGGYEGEGDETFIPLVEVPREKVIPPVIEPIEGGTYFTRINFWCENARSSATNYSRGRLIPINTEVQLTEVGTESFTLSVPSAGFITIENVPKYTYASINDLLARYLASERTNIELYDEATTRNMLAGTIRRGMTKDQVLMTRGYPPAHETSTLGSDVWIYWTSRFVKWTIVFENDRVVKGRGIN